MKICIRWLDTLIILKFGISILKLKHTAGQRVIQPFDKRILTSESAYLHSYNLFKQFKMEISDIHIHCISGVRNLRESWISLNVNTCSFWKFSWPRVDPFHITHTVIPMKMEAALDATHITKVQKYIGVENSRWVMFGL